MGEVVALVAGRAKAGAALPKPKACKTCDEPIETARLQVNPKAVRCIGCQRECERNELRALAFTLPADVVIIRG